MYTVQDQRSPHANSYYRDDCQRVRDLVSVSQKKSSISCPSNQTHHRKGIKDASVYPFKIGTCQKLLARLKSSNPLMARLRPSMFLIGSTYEGTRIGRADEVDITLKFEGISPFVYKPKDPTSLYSRVQISHPLEYFINSANGKLDYEKFLKFLMESISEALNTIDLPERIRIKSRTPCPDCGTTEPYVQCTDCLVGCSMTKIGPCLQFLWSQNGTATSVPCSIDLVPVYPLQFSGTVAELFSEINKHVMTQEPEGCLSHFKAYITRDRVIGLQQEKEEGTSAIHYVAVKILNFGPGPMNHTIRPGQEINTEKLQDDSRHREVYCLVKALKDVLEVNEVKSILVKKLILRQEFALISFKSLSKYDGLFRVLSHPEFKLVFEDKIDFGLWEARLQGNRGRKAEEYKEIPLVLRSSRPRRSNITRCFRRQ